MTYQVKFQRTGVKDVRAGLFGTFREARAFAAKQQSKLRTDSIIIVEIDEDGEEFRTHPVIKL